MLLDLSPYLGQRLEATVYELQEELPEFLRPCTKARAVLVTHKGKIIGAWIDKGRHYAFACSLDRKPLEEITGMSWSEWLVASGVVNLENEVERELATLTPEEAAQQAGASPPSAPGLEAACIRSIAGERGRREKRHPRLVGCYPLRLFPDIYNRQDTCTVLRRSERLFQTMLRLTRNWCSRP